MSIKVSKGIHVFFISNSIFWVEHRVAKPLMQFEHQSCLLVAYYFIILG